MSPMPNRARLLDVVQLLSAQADWPAGTIGTVVDALDDHATVEIADEDGETLAILETPYDALRVVASPPDEAGRRLAV